MRAGFPYLKTLGRIRLTDFPVDVAIGGKGCVYVLCRSVMVAIGNRVIRKLNLDDDDLGGIGSARSPVLDSAGRDHGEPGGQFVWPAAILVDHEENLLVSDEELHRISVLSAEGELLDQWGEHGEGDGQLNRPSGIAFDADENVFVVDTLNHRVQRFTKNGQFLAKWGTYGSGDGELDMPWGITVDELDHVYVADWRNDRIQKFTADGELVSKFGRPGSGSGEFHRPTGVEVDGDGDIYVADAGNNRVQLFDPEGRYVQRFLGDATLSKSASLLFDDAEQTPPAP